MPRAVGRNPRGLAGDEVLQEDVGRVDAGRPVGVPGHQVAGRALEDGLGPVQREGDVVGLSVAFHAGAVGRDQRHRPGDEVLAKHVADAVRVVGDEVGSPAREADPAIPVREGEIHRGTVGLPA